MHPKRTAIVNSKGLATIERNMHAVVLIGLLGIGCVGAFEKYHETRSWKEFEFEETIFGKLICGMSTTPLSDRERFPQIKEKTQDLPKFFLVTREGKYGLHFNAHPPPNKRVNHFKTTEEELLQFISFDFVFTMGSVTRLHLNFKLFPQGLRYTIILRVFLPSDKEFHRWHAENLIIYAEEFKDVIGYLIQQADTKERGVSFPDMRWLFSVLGWRARLDYIEKTHDGVVENKVFRGAPIVVDRLKELDDMRRKMKAR